MAVEQFGAWSLVPPLLAIVLAIITRKAVLSLFLGIWSGGLIFTFPDSFDMASGWFADIGLSGLVLDIVSAAVALVISAVWGFPQALDWVTEAVADSFHVQIIIFTLLLGSAVAMIWRTGGSHALRDWALQRLATQRQAGLATFALGLVMFFDDYANTAIVGSTMKDVSDRMRI
ncbi:MAG: Na+/H+ antiporter NhaC family protein, partial [Halobacteriota archaeon]